MDSLIPLPSLITARGARQGGVTDGEGGPGEHVLTEPEVAGPEPGRRPVGVPQQVERAVDGPVHGADAGSLVRTAEHRCLPAVAVPAGVRGDAARGDAGD